MLVRLLGTWVVLLGLLGATAHADDVQRVEAYLAANHPRRTWDLGPTAVDGDAIRKTYGTALRFYMVHSSPPLPPGAPSPEGLRHHRDGMARYTREKVSLVVSVDRAGVVRPIRAPADYMRGFRPPRTDAERRVAAAAIASLTAGSYTPPGELRADEVELTRDGAQYVGTAQRRHVRGVSVWFDARGRIVRINAADLIAMPPSAAPRR